MTCRRHIIAAAWTSATAALALLSACTAGPDYRRPEVPVAPAYKELGDWKPATPAEDTGPGPWWRVFKDEDLNRLEDQIDISNQTVKAAADAGDASQWFRATVVIVVISDGTTYTGTGVGPSKQPDKSFTEQAQGWTWRLLACHLQAD